MQTNIVLSIKNSPTAIPYPASDRGDTPHQGFKPLKGRPKDVAAIPAVQESEALKLALAKINDSSTPFFTVACKKVLNNRAGKFWTRGYLEFAINYPELALESPNYYLLFEQFNRHVHDANLDLPVDFNFELQPTEFRGKKASGYTACVWITTAEFPNDEGAHKIWNMSVSFLADFLKSFEKPDLPAIYEPPKVRKGRQAKTSNG